MSSYYLDRIPHRNPNVKTSVLLRESWREGRAIRKKTLFNLTHFSPTVQQNMLALMRGGVVFDSAKDAVFHSTRPAARTCGGGAGHESTAGAPTPPASLPQSPAQSGAGRHHRSLAAPGIQTGHGPWIDPETATSSLGKLLHLGSVSGNEMLSMLDWLAGRQRWIEKSLAHRHLKGGTLLLYDVSSSYLEGSCCPLAQYGYNRDGKIKQRIIRHLGTAETEEGVKKLMALGEALKQEMREAVQPSLSPADLMAPSQSPESSASKPLNVDLRQLRETERYIQGVHRIYGQIYQELGLHRLLPVSRYRSSSQALQHCVMARLANPQSKRASVDQLEQDMGVHLPLEKVYRMMDHLDDQRITRLKEMAWRAATRLYPEPVNVLLFDCTTLYFESVQEDALRQTGYSKDGQVQGIAGGAGVGGYLRRLAAES